MSLDVSVIDLAKKTWKEFGRDHVPRLGAALAYYSFTSFFPLLLVLISLIGIALSAGLPVAVDAREYVINAVTDTLPAARDLIEQSIQDTEQNSSTLGFVGLLTGLWAASNIFAQLEQAFNVIYDVVPRKKSFKEKLQTRGQAALIVVILAALMLASLILSSVLSMADSVARSLPAGGYLAWGLNLGISLIILAGVFAALFKYVPDRRVTWKAALIGGIFTSVTWQIGRELLTWWLGRSGGVTAGTVVGSVLAFLFLVYYGSQILLMGAQLTATYDEMANPGKVRDKTADNSALRGPGRGIDTQSGKLARESTEAPTAPRLATVEPVPRGELMRYRPAHSFTSFGLGYLAGLATLVVGLRMVAGKVMGKVLG